MIILRLIPAFAPILAMCTFKMCSRRYPIMRQASRVLVVAMQPIRFAARRQ